MVVVMVMVAVMVMHPLNCSKVHPWPNASNCGIGLWARYAEVGAIFHFYGTKHALYCALMTTTMVIMIMTRLNSYPCWIRPFLSLQRHLVSVCRCQRYTCNKGWNRHCNHIIIMNMIISSKDLSMVKSPLRLTSSFCFDHRHLVV